MSDARSNVKNQVSLSFEVFPPNTWLGIRKLNETCQQFGEFAPRFISVTFGAIGANQFKTLRMVRQLRRKELPTTPHLSCVGMTKARLEKLLAIYQRYEVKHLVVLRGDMTQPIVSDYRFASQLVAAIRKLSGDYFHIIVAAYPEFHPEAKNADLDLRYFQEKVDAGANSAITQFFFNSDAYFHFCDTCERLGIRIPIIPGIMPIYDFQKLTRFAATCGAEIPLWLRKRCEAYGQDFESLRDFGVDVVNNLCERLLFGGVRNFHFYTLNQYPMVAKLIDDLFLKDRNQISVPSRKIPELAKFPELAT